MMGAKTIGCINHPGVEAIGRCRQCSKPVCKQCGVVASTGIYCSEVCSEKHQQFLQRASALDLDKGYKRGFFFHVRQFMGLVIVLAVFLFALGIVASFVYIPFLTDATIRVRSLVGF